MPSTTLIADSGYQGIYQYHSNSKIPIKNSKKNPLTKENKKFNRELSSKRIIIENVFSSLKIFKILDSKYRNRRKRLPIRFNLICAIYNLNALSDF